MQDFNQNLSFINNKFKNLSLDKHFHEEYSFSLIYGGNHIYENEQDKFNLSSGILQVVNPNELHSTQNSSWSYLNIMIRSDLINDVVKNLEQNDKINTILFKPIINDKKAINLFNQLFILLNNKKENKISIDSCLIEFLEYIIEFHSSNKLSKIENITSSKKMINRALEYMNNYNKTEELTLSSIANEIEISKYHFIKEFKKHTGITPNQYLQIKKVNWTKELLQKNIPLSHIAYECGFTDQSYMIKVFKRFYGYTPTKLKKILY